MSRYLLDFSAIPSCENQTLSVADLTLKKMRPTYFFSIKYATERRASKQKKKVTHYRDLAHPL